MRAAAPSVRLGSSCVLAALLAASPWLVSCGGDGDASGAAACAAPVAAKEGVPVYADAFRCFRTWYSVAAEPPPGVDFSDAGAADAGIHSLGPMTAFISQRPPPGSTEFPIGTIIVKETNGGDLGSRQVFAMEKRGANFDPTGAVGWEWFELKNIDDKAVSILWRGNGPTAGETYGGNPMTCNVCHEGAKANDYVWTQAFKLSSF